MKRSSNQVAREKVLDVLRQRISDRQLQPGVKLTEQELSSEFGVTRTAIRQVLAELEKQDLVERIPNKGTIVRKMDPDSLIEIYEIREFMEGLAARRAALHSKPRDWEGLNREFGKPCERMVKNLEFDQYLALITKLRQRMVEKAQSRELSKLIDSIYVKIRIVQRRVIILPGRIQKGMLQHREVIKALMEGDPDKAEQMKRRNLQSAREDLLKYQNWIL
jgi:DNA-binding GntR family transcriptional regulator